MNTAKYGKTTIDHNIRMKLKITIEQYVFLDCIYNKKATSEEIIKRTGLSAEETLRIFIPLKGTGLVETNGNIITTTDLWNLYFDLKDITPEVIEYLNKITGSDYKVQTKSTVSAVKARIKEGYSLDDFKMVIDFLNYKWGSDSQMQQYLRPATMFGNKFEGYLQAAKKEKPKPITNTKMAGMVM